MKNILILCLSLAVFSCVDPTELDDMDVELVENIPVTANTPNAFSYVIRANEFSQQMNSSLNFDSASFVMSLVIADYSNGSLLLSIYNEDSSQVYRQQVSSSMVLSDFPAFRPTALELTLDDFGGSVNLAIADDN
ncbi:hypothetical protein [Marinoscillum sp.]|uniref:hypothetical protein n=1 Tax=Marinoscillum sp. TaxID=2024838 RepID=UPI003BAAB39C